MNNLKRKIWQSMSNEAKQSISDCIDVNEGILDVLNFYECEACDDIIITYDYGDEAFNEDGESIELRYSPKINEYIHEHDFEDDMIGTLVSFHPDGGQQIFELGDYEDTSSDGDLVNLERIIDGIEWHNTDGWRGYHDVKLKDPYVKFEDGWVTGYPDETTTRKADLGELFEKLKEGEITPPVEMHWVFLQTSNVFSTSSSIIIRDGDMDAVQSWLENLGWNVERLRDAFG